jgi:hypothetical protein
MALKVVLSVLALGQRCHWLVLRVRMAACSLRCRSGPLGGTLRDTVPQADPAVMQYGVHGGQGPNITHCTLTSCDCYISSALMASATAIGIHRHHSRKMLAPPEGAQHN